MAPSGAARAIPACLLALFLCSAILTSAVVPPWQGPDEPTHYVLAHALALPEVRTAPLVTLAGRPLVTTVEHDLQRATLASMARYRWWESYGSSRPPDPLPTLFVDASKRLGTGTYVQPLYYGLAALVVRGVPAADVDRGYWRLRLLSIALCATALMLGWAGTRLLFGSEVAAGATLLAALLPQFLLTAISVNSDALLILLGAVLWWQGARLVTGHSRGLALLIVLIVAMAALLTKRNAVPLLGIAILVAAAGSLRPGTWLLRHVLVVAGAAAGTLVIAWTLFDIVRTPLLVFLTNALNIRRVAGTTTLLHLIDFGRISVDFAWLIGGWQRFPAPEPWLWVARILTIAGFGGAMFVTFRSASSLRRSLSFAWVFVVIHCGMVLGLSFWTLQAPQGRYLFPVIAPAAALVWVGMTRLGPPRFRPYVAPALVGVVAVLNVTAFTATLMPAYLPW